MLLPYKLSKILKLKGHVRKMTVSLDNLNFLKTFIARFQNYLFIW